MAADSNSRTTRVYQFAIFLASAVMLVVSWRRWTSPIADSGREMDLPLRLAGGEILYRDVHYIYPPLSPYFNAMLYRIAGPHLDVLWLSGIACGGLLLWLCYRISRRLLKPGGASLATISILLFCIFKPSGNLISPYAYAALQGTLFALGVLVLALRYAEQRARLNLIGAGMLIGLAAITKQEFAIAGAITLAAMLAYLYSPGFKTIARELLWAALPALLIAVPVYALLFYRIGWETLVEDCHLFFTYLPASLKYYNAQRTGSDRPLFSLLQMMGGAATGIAAMSGVVLMGSRTRHTWAWAGPVFALSLLGVLSIRILAGRQWDGSPVRALPLLLVVLVVVEWRRKDRGHHNAALFVISVYSLAVLARVALRVPSGGAFGGFFLPTSLILFVWLFTRALPVIAGRWLARDLSSRTLRKASFSLLALTLLISAIVFGVRYRKNYNYRIEAERGYLFAPKNTGPAIESALRFIESATRPGEAIAVFPEGSDLAFLTGRRVNIRHQILIPGLMREEDERRAIDLLEREKTRYVFIVNRPMREFGSEAFGRDFYPALGQWIEANYHLVKICGRSQDPRQQIGDPEFFIKILARNGLPAGAR